MEKTKNYSYLAFNYILIFLILTNLSFGLFRIYKAEGLTKIHIFVAPIIATFFIYFLLKQKEWIYQFIIGINVISLIVNIAGFGLLYLITIDTLAQFLMIGISYYLLTEINPKRYKKIGMI